MLSNLGWYFVIWYFWHTKTNIILIFAELSKILQGKPNVDLPGLIILTLNTFPLFILVLLPTSIWFDFDAGYYTTNSFMEGNSCMGLFLRYVTLQWACVEGARTYSFWLSTCLGIVTSTRNIVAGISIQNLSFTSLNDYRKLKIVTEAMRQVTRIMMGVIMAAGFFIAIFLNFLVLTCRHSIPAQLYVFICLMVCCLYMIILFNIPFGVDVYTWSKGLVERTWGLELVSKQSLRSKFEFRLMRKWLRAQNYVAFYYGIAIFDEETRRSYYWNKVMYTINLILVK